MAIRSNYLKKRYKLAHNMAFQEAESSSQTLLLSSCPSWIILIASGLWLAQASPLKAMDPPGNPAEEPTHSSPVSSPRSKFYQDDGHPLTQEFWKGRDLSERLKKLKLHVDTIKDDILNHTRNLTEIIKENLKDYKEILQCRQCDPFLPVQDLKNIHLDEQHIIPFIDRDKSEMPKGWSKANVVTFPYKAETFSVVSGTKGGTLPNLIAIKKFGDIETGLRELFESLLALELNPAPQRLKMARVYDAVICPDNCLSIIMEAVGTQDIHTFLSTDSSKDAENSINTIKACADYLATFHIENHRKLNQGVNRKKYIEHVAQFFNSLLQDTLEEQHEKFKLLFLRPRDGVSDDHLVQSDNVVSLLSKEDQEKFERLTERNCSLFKKNTEKIFRLLRNNEKLEDYFLTTTHGDAHAHNFFYDNSKFVPNGPDIPPDSFQRVSMIDFATIGKTYGSIGDPAEDVGRFLAALRNWWAIEPENNNDDNKVSNFQKEFMNRYLETIKKSGIIEEKNQKAFEKRFKENCSFYKLRYYRAIFNVKKNDNLEKDREIKKKFLESWIKENADLESSSRKKPKKIVQRKKSKVRDWTSVCTDRKQIIHWLPDRDKEFIESGGEGSESYLTRLWEELQHTGTATLSSTAAIAGMGGIGKTTLALEYAHEALENKAYNVIHWIYSETERSLIKGYKELLLKILEPELRASVKYATDEQIVDLIKQHVPKIENSLIVYDNVPDPDFLKEKIPENAHCLMTSRYSSEGWEKPPLMLDVFREEDSKKYLCKTTGFEPTSDTIGIVEELANALGHFPLALALAAHYIKLVGGNRVTEEHFKDYLAAFKKGGLENFEENRHPLTEAQSKITYKNLIAKTLEISKQYISRIAANSTLAEEIMGFCAYLDPDAIIEDIFLEYCRDKEKLKKVLELLSGLSFLKKGKDDGTFSIHRLVQLVLMKETESKANPQHEKIFSSIVPVFNRLFEKNAYTEEQLNKLKKIYLIYFNCLDIQSD